MRACNNAVLTLNTNPLFFFLSQCFLLLLLIVGVADSRTGLRRRSAATTCRVTARSCELMSGTAMQTSDTRWFAGTQACALRHSTGARLRAGWGRSICYLHCSCGHALRFPSCLPALAEMFIFNSRERETPRPQRGRVCPKYQQLSCF